MWRDRSLYTPQIKLFALLYSPVHKQRHRKRLESFIFGSGADDPGLCSFIGEHFAINKTGVGITVTTYNRSPSCIIYQCDERRSDISVTAKKIGVVFI